MADGARVSRRAPAYSDAPQMTASRHAAAISGTPPGHDAVCGAAPARRRTAAAGDTSEASANTISCQRGEHGNAGMAQQQQAC